MDKKECESRGGSWVRGQCHGERVNIKTLLLSLSVIFIIITVLVTSFVFLEYMEQREEERLGENILGEEKTPFFSQTSSLAAQLGLDSPFYMVLVIALLIVSIIILIQPIPFFRIIGGILFVISIILLIIIVGNVLEAGI